MFSFPRPTAPSDGTTPLQFTVLAASPSGAQSTSAPQLVYFDGLPPAISVAPDSTPYARSLPDGGAAPISVSVTIVDGSGVASPQLLSGTAVVPPASSNGNVYVFPLDARGAPAGTQGAYSFHIRAVDRLGHDGGADGTRVIDDVPPVISAVQVYKDLPDGGGVTYPAAVPSTGWNGATFVYSDTVHVQGTISDPHGIGSATLRLDGIALDGGASLGTSRPLGCAPSAISCPFSLDVTLNDAGSEFHTGLSSMPAGMLQVTIEARDTAVGYGGTPAANAATSATTARATRLLWQKTVAGTAVSGLAVHPSGDVIVTMSGSVTMADDTVYALAPDQPLTRWGRRPASGMPGTPAIGAGDATNARIYIASSFGDLYAINPDGSRAWTATLRDNLNFSVGPAVIQLAGGVEQIIVPSGVITGNAQLWRASSVTGDAGVPIGGGDLHAAPIILDGGVYFAIQNEAGTASHVTKHSIAADGALGAAITSTVDGGAPYFGLVTDGTKLYAATRPTTGAGVLVKLDTDNSFTQLWGNSLTSALAAEPTFGIDGKLYGADLGSKVSSFDAATGAATQFLTLATVGLTPLQGSDGHVYLPRRSNVFSAFAGNQLSWTFAPPSPVLRYAIMDCQGRVFVGSGATVSAFVSDDRGLADTPWPSLRRDARNTGNAGALKYGVRTIAGCTQ
jgi:hypothetical protein